MNEIKKCSLSGISFTFDIKAYTRLDEYISSLKKAYENTPDGPEIIADIEARIAELILSAQHDEKYVVQEPLICNIIKQLGTAEDIADTEPEKSEPRIPKRLYRDVQNGKLGGVCAGLGKYFNIDPVIIRLILFIPLLLLPIGSISDICASTFLMFIVGYIIMWFAVPVARTARQKLEMEGEAITVRSISDKTGATPEQTAKSSVASAVTVLGRILVILLKLFLAAMLFPLVISLIALIVSIIAIIADCTPLTNEFMFGNMGSLTDVLTTVPEALAILGITIALIPVAVLTYMFITLLVNKRPNKWVLLSSLILWVIVFVSTVIVAVKQFPDGMTVNNGGITITAIDAPSQDQLDQMEALIYEENVESIDK